MRGVLLLLAAVVLAALLVRVSMEDPGYVLISRAPHEVEISLSLFLLVLKCLVPKANYCVLQGLVNVLQAGAAS